MSIRDQDRIGLWVALAFLAWVLLICLSALFAPAAAPSRKGGTHAATWENPRGSKYELSQHIQLGFTFERLEREPVSVRERAVWRSLVAQRGIRNYSTVAGSNPVTAPHPNSEASAQQQESATRLASVDDLASRSTGSAPAQPELIEGVS
jgi:hypothetical protein